MYKLIADHSVIGKINSVVRLTDGFLIPFDPANTDYQEYLAWIEAGNVPLPPTQEN